MYTLQASVTQHTSSSVHTPPAHTGTGVARGYAALHKKVSHVVGASMQHSACVQTQLPVVHVAGAHVVASSTLGGRISLAPHGMSRHVGVGRQHVAVPVVTYVVACAAALGRLPAGHVKAEHRGRATQAAAEHACVAAPVQGTLLRGREPDVPQTVAEQAPYAQARFAVQHSPVVHAALAHGVVLALRE
jgi:hypothetical protein